MRVEDTSGAEREDLRWKQVLWCVVVFCEVIIGDDRDGGLSLLRLGRIAIGLSVTIIHGLSDSACISVIGVTARRSIGSARWD
jgi:hypothetical protein